MTALNEVQTHWRSMYASPVHALPELADSEPDELVHAVEAAAGEIEESALASVTQQGSGIVFQARDMLVLLTFWYTHQVYGSAEIVTRLSRDLARFHFRCEHLPDAQTLRRFRADNRAALHTCLTSVLCFLAREKMLRGIVTHVSESQLAEEATRRIIMAMFTDSLELNKECVTQTELEPCFVVAKE